MNQLVLSLFPGADLLGLGFQEAWPELCIVRGPDIQYGSLHDIKHFHAQFPPGIIEGVIGGPPCQAFSQLAHIVRANGYEVAENLIPEYERIVDEAQPRWFLMENVKAAPEPIVSGYAVHSFMLDNRWIGGAVGEEQQRRRRFSFGLRGVRAVDLRAFIDYAALENPTWAYAVTCDSRQVPVALLAGAQAKRPKGGGVMPHCGPKLSTEEALRLQGLPGDFFGESPFTVKGQQRLIGNGVPLPLGRAVATAIRRALEAIDQERAA